MKICFFNCTKAWGGGEKWHLDHALSLRDDGHEVVLATGPGGELLRRAGAENIRTRAFNIRNLSILDPIQLFQVYSFLKSEKFDIIILNFSKDLKIAAPMARLAGIPKIIYRRGSAIPIKDTAFNRFLFGKCLTHVLANSEKTKKTILRNNPDLFPEENITVIYNGIDTRNYQYIPCENEIPVIGNIGRLVFQKRQDILIDVAAILRERGVKCKFRIGGDGILMKELKDQVQEKGLSDYVEFTGFVEDANDFLQHIDIFALTSKWEGFCYVLTEAMLARKPLVAFNTSSNPELVSEGINGKLIPMGDRIAFADAIQYLIENPQIRKLYGENGSSIVGEKFDFAKNKERVMDLLLH
jgi:glycosyltransferase involved in cell wall biosynthesis